MNYYYFMAFIFITLTSCLSGENKEEIKKIVTEEVKKQPVFLFDSIIHYSIAIAEDTLWGIERIKNKTKEQRRLIEVVLHEKLDTLLDTTSLIHLSSLGFTKRYLSNEKTEALRGIFYSQNMNNELATICEPIYRDILVFRLKSRNTGVMKLCFDCFHHNLDGAQFDTKNITLESWTLLKKVLHE
jgi:hypothetical protein